MGTTSCYQFGSKVKLFLIISRIFQQTISIYECYMKFYYITKKLRHPHTYIHMVLHKLNSSVISRDKINVTSDQRAKLLYQFKF